MNETRLNRYITLIFLPTAVLVSFAMAFMIIQYQLIHGICYAIPIGMIDMLICRKVLVNLERNRDDKNTTLKQFSFLTYGFFVRLIIIIGGYFGLEQVEEGAGAAFAIAYLVLHFSIIGGFALATMKNMKEEQFYEDDADYDDEYYYDEDEYYDDEEVTD